MHNNSNNNYIMNIVKQLDQYDDSYVYFGEPIKNNVMNDSVFIRILYSNSLMTLSGIYLLINIKDLECEKYYNKFKCSFNAPAHIDIIHKIKQIEFDLLQKIEIKNKIPQYKIYDLFKNGVLKFFNEIIPKENNNFILKISGIWETPYTYGLTYKLIYVQPE